MIDEGESWEQSCIPFVSAVWSDVESIVNLDEDILFNSWNNILVLSGGKSVSFIGFEVKISSLLRSLWLELSEREGECERTFLFSLLVTICMDIDLGKVDSDCATRFCEQALMMLCEIVLGGA